MTMNTRVPARPSSLTQRRLRSFVYIYIYIYTCIDNATTNYTINNNHHTNNNDCSPASRRGQDKHFFLQKCRNIP